MDNSQNSNKTFLAVAVLVVIVVVFFGFSKMNSNKQKATSLIGLNGTPSSRLVDSRAREDYELDEDGNPMKPMAVCAITVTSDPSTQSTTALPGVGNQEIARFVAVNPCVDDVMLDKVDYMYIQSGNTWGIRDAYLADSLNMGASIPSPIYIGFPSQFHFDVNNNLVIPANSTRTFVVNGYVHDEPGNGGPTWSGPLDQAQTLAINITANDVNGPVTVLGSPALQTYTH
jgi:hypothetical protein